DALRRELPRLHEMVDKVADGHGDEDPRLRKLRDIYVAFEGACNTTRATLAALEELEREMHRHVHTENNVLFPRFRVTSKM
ncbi:MAG: hemerythrin domain-containing protein, partial [bacterium]